MEKLPDSRAQNVRTVFMALIRLQSRHGVIEITRYLQRIYHSQNGAHDDGSSSRFGGISDAGRPFVERHSITPVFLLDDEHSCAI
jgi:hypothetical protein